ncbi:hypothetical protein BC629DRAFT_340416 [Irpex lacteus]|nr:hypothetical protein BC629DRAFT_340416 [Irpex lacteus]
MNRTGQPPQRPPSLGPNPALGGAFQRGPYPTFGMPPRNVLPGFQTLPNHRTQQNIVPQPSPNFIQQRGQSAFPFGGGIQQQSQASSQHTQQTALSHATHQQQPPPPSATTPSLPPHLSQNAAPSLTTAPSVSSASEAGLDHSEFPALGSTPTSLNTPSTTNATSYASQAGTGAGVGVVGNGAQTAAQRDFTPDDFPALGGSGPGSQQQSSQANQSAADGHPPGLNGFRQNNDPAHQQTLLGALSGGGQQQPGLLNLSGQARNQAGFQSEADKRLPQRRGILQTQIPVLNSSSPLSLRRTAHIQTTRNRLSRRQRRQHNLSSTYQYRQVLLRHPNSRNSNNSLKQMPLSIRHMLVTEP